MKRGYGGMITIENDGVHCSLMIGGIGSPPTIELPNTQYVKLSNGCVQTDEHNMYNICTGKHVITYDIIVVIISFIGEWTTPTVIGKCMPNCSGFTVNNINKSKAIIFGGWTGTGTTSNVHVIDVTSNTVVSY